MCGGIFTIIARVIILIAISKAATEVISMQEPDIKSLSRQLSLEDRQEMGQVKFD